MSDIARFDFDEDALRATLDLIGRSGAKSLEFGYLDEDAEQIKDADWYAFADYGGIRLIEEHHRGPIEALDALARRLLRGSQCRRCGDLVSLSEEAEGLCRWRRQADRWVPGCGRPIDQAIPAPLANRAERRRRRKS